MKCKLTLLEKLKDLCALTEYYHVSADYLPGITDTKSQLMLKLDDDTIELLKNGHSNHRLLCEIIKHPAFEKYASSSLHLLCIYKKDTPSLECPLPFLYVR